MRRHLYDAVPLKPSKARRSVLVFGGNGFLGLTFVEVALLTSPQLNLTVVHRGTNQLTLVERGRST